MTEAIENQVERFAPGFRDTVVERVTKNAVQMEAVEPQPRRRGHLQRRGVGAADARPAGAAVEHLQDAGARDVPGVGGHPARALRCTASAATTPPGWPCARSSASAGSRRCARRCAEPSATAARRAVRHVRPWRPSRHGSVRRCLVSALGRVTVRRGAGSRAAGVPCRPGADDRPGQTGAGAVHRGTARLLRLDHPRSAGCGGRRAGLRPVARRLAAGRRLRHGAAVLAILRPLASPVDRAIWAWLAAAIDRARPGLRASSCAIVRHQEPMPVPVRRPTPAWLAMYVLMLAGLVELARRRVRPAVDVARARRRGRRPRRLRGRRRAALPDRPVAWPPRGRRVRWSSSTWPTPCWT